MIINGAEEVSKDSFIGHMLCKLIGDEFDKYIKDPKNISVVIFINNKEVDVIKFFNSLNSSVEEYAAKRATELIINRIGDFKDKLFGVVEDIEFFVKDKIRDAFPDVSSDEDY